MNDPRVEIAAKAMCDPKPNQIKYGEDLEEWMDRVMPSALAAADQADREQGIHRITINDDTVERVTEALKESLFDRGLRVQDWPADEAAAYRDNGGFMEGTEAAQALRFQKAARAVLRIVRGAPRDVRSGQ